MNKGKQLVVALLVFGALVGAALLVWRDPFEKSSRTDYSGLLPPRPEGSIEQITVTTRDGSITAEKRGDTWWITAPRELPADDGQLKAAASSLEKVAVVDTASRKPERHAEYGLAKESSERIEVKASAAGKEVLNLAAGKRAPDGGGSFVVLSREPATVFVTSTPLPPLFSRELKEWRGKSVLNLPRETLERVRIVTGKGTLDLEKTGEDTWRKTGDAAWQADMARFGQVLDALSRLSWVEIVDDPPSVTDYGFTTPPARVTATAAGKDYVLVFGKDAEGTTGNCWAKIEGDPKVYQVRKALLDRFTRDFDYYRGETPKPEAEEPKKAN